MTVFASGGKARTFNYQAGDVGYVAAEMAHYVQNLDDEPLLFLELFRSPRFADFSRNQWMALTPACLIEAHLNLDAATIAALRRDKTDHRQIARAQPSPTSRPPARGEGAW